MKATDILYYVHNAACYCPECAGTEWGPVFVGDEPAPGVTCDDCGKYLTPDYSWSDDLDKYIWSRCPECNQREPVTRYSSPTCRNCPPVRLLVDYGDGTIPFATLLDMERKL